MVEIIKAGELPGRKRYRANCYSCKTEFSFIASEAQEHFDQRDGDYLSITCPLPGCGETVRVQKYSIQFGVNER